MAVAYLSTGAARRAIRPHRMTKRSDGVTDRSRLIGIGEWFFCLSLLLSGAAAQVASPERFLFRQRV
jgi:hypothetical protein